jgi:hypothetical protein
MAKINSLTPEQIARFPEFIDKWTKIGLSTEPADREAAEAGVAEAYRAANLLPPRVVWCSSPLAMGLTRALLLDKKFIKNFGDSVGASVWASVWDSVGASVGASVWDSVWASVGDSVGASVGASVRNSVRDSVWDSVWDSVGASVRDSVRDSVGASVWASVRDSVWASVWASVGASVRDSVGASVRNSGYGQHDASWVGFYDFFSTVCGLVEQAKKISGLTTLTKSAGWYLPHEKICWISERHCVVHQDETRRIHCEDGPAIAYPDGWAIYAIHGVRVPEYVILHPGEITVEKIDAEQNAEVRRVMIERYKFAEPISGAPAFLRDADAELLDHDADHGRLLRRQISGDEPIVMVQVLNPTPEPEGPLSEMEAREVFGDSAVDRAMDNFVSSATWRPGAEPRFKVYFLRVHPELRPMKAGQTVGGPQNMTALNAVASTWGLTGEEFLPEFRA